jgi:hypothetical protein
MIRILTLLVSLFTFGLVDLAEITYEIPVTDMLYFNDTPIEELNGLTLNEIFRDSNIVLNPDFTDGLTGWHAGGSTFSSVNNDYVQVNSTTSYGYAAQFNKKIIGNIYYQVARAKKISGTMTFFDFGNDGLNVIVPTESFQQFSAKATATETIFLVRGRGTPNYTFQIDYAYAFNLTSLGISTLTKEQLDLYYQLWLNPELNITYEINTLDTQDLIILLASQSVWTIMIHLLYKYAYRPKKKSKRLGM